MQDLISIIIPVYNHAEALQRSLDSIKDQTYRNLEVIIIDDGSDTPVGEYASFPYPVQVHRQENKGAPAARNKGLTFAKGAYIIFWDADVMADRTMLEKMHHVLTLHPEAAYVYSSFYFGKKAMQAKKFSVVTLQECNYIHSTSLIRKEAVIAWDQSLKRFQDWDMWLSLAEQGSHGIWIPEFLFTVEPREEGMSTWLPSFAYKAPFKHLPGISKKVKAYTDAERIIREKHNI